MRRALVLAVTAALARALPLDSLPPKPDIATRDFGIGWDLSRTAADWFEANRADILQQHPLALSGSDDYFGDASSADTLLQRRNWKIPTAGLPPLPLTYWLLANSSGLPVLANAAVRRMQTWYFENTNLYNMTSWWQHPVIINSYIDLDRATGQNTNEQVVRAILDNNDRGVTYMIDKYIDDQAWWGLALAKAYQQYGISSYLDAAKTIQSADESAVTSDCGGGVVWLTYKSYIKNTVSNTLHIALSAKLYRITGSSGYLQAATSTLEWWLGWAYDSSSGAVYDTIESPDCSPINPNLYTYNAGIILGGLADLFVMTGNQTYITIAHKIAYNAMAVFSNGHGIMREPCEHDGPINNDNSGGISSSDGAPLDNLPGGCQNDNIMFKGIFAQNLGYLYRVTNDTQIANYLTINAFSSAFYNMDNTFLFGEWWDGPFNATLANVLTQGNALGLLSAAVSVTLAQQAAQLASQGLPPASVTNAFTVYLPTGGVSEADTTSLRKRWFPPQRTASPSI